MEAESEADVRMKEIAGGVTGIRQVPGALPCLPPVGVGDRDCPPGGCGGSRMPCAEKQATCRSTGQRKWTAWRLPVHGMEKCRRRDRAGAEEWPIHAGVRPPRCRGRDWWQLSWGPLRRGAGTLPRSYGRRTCLRRLFRRCTWGRPGGRGS